MLSHARRLRYGEVVSISRQGFFIRVPIGTFRYVKGSGRFAVVVSKKTAPSAVMRHQLKRKIYTALREVAPHVPIDGVLYASVFGMNADTQTIDMALRDMLKSAWSKLSAR